jgi:hypothetical protein
MCFKIKYFLLKTEWMCCKFSLVLFYIEEAYKSLEDLDLEILFFFTLVLFLFAYINFYKKKVCTMHLLFNIKFFFLLKSNLVEEQLSLIPRMICAV